MFCDHETSTKVVPGCNREIHSHQQATMCRYKLKKTVFGTWYDALFSGRDWKRSKADRRHTCSHWCLTSQHFKFLGRRCWATFRTTRKQSWPSSFRTRCPEAKLLRPFFGMKFRNSWEAAQKQFITKLIVQGLLMLLEACLGGWHLWGPLLQDIMGIPFYSICFARTVSRFDVANAMRHWQIPP